MGRRKLTPEDLIIRRNSLIEKVHQDRPHIEIRGDYVNSTTGIECYCTIHKHTWFPTPAELSRGKGCYICANIKNGQKARLSQEEFSNRVKNLNSNIEIISEYINQKTPVKCRCVIHNIEWEGKPMNLMNGENCPQCTVENKIDNRRWSKERFNTYMAQERPDIQVLGEYVNSKTKLPCKCLVCGNEWMAKPNGLKMGHGCPECSKKSVGRKRALSQDEFVSRVNKIFPKLEVRGEYKNYDTKIECYCQIHQYTWHPSPHNLLNEHGCPYCCKERLSLPNRMIRGLLTKLNADNRDFEYSPDWIGRYRYDAYFKHNGTSYVVEMDGKFHFDAIESIGITEDMVKDTQVRDRIKDILAKEHNIEVIRINCEPSTKSNIIKQLKASKLSEMFDLDNFDWESIMYYNQTLLETICECYNTTDRKTVTNVSSIVKINKVTVSKYLRKGTELGLCNYIPHVVIA